MQIIKTHIFIVFAHLYNSLREKNKHGFEWSDVRIGGKTGSDKIFALLDEVSNDLEDDIENLMNDSDTQFVLEESLENELDSDDEPLNLLVPEANYHVVKNPTIENLRRK